MKRLFFINGLIVAALALAACGRGGGDEIIIDGLTEADAMATAQAEGDIMMEEPMMADVAGALLTGTFVDIDVVHRGSGTATIVELADGSFMLRLEDDFMVTRGPDLHVFLSGSEEPRNSDGVMTEPALDLGQLKGNMGSQNYEIPASFDVSNAKSVVIYCVPFRVVFSTATLSPSG